PEEAVQTLLDGWGTGWRVPPITLDGIYPDLARLALATGHTAELAPIADALDRLAESYEAGDPSGAPGPASVRAAAMLVQGVVARDAAGLLAAADGYRGAGRILHEGYAYECAGRVLAE